MAIIIVSFIFSFILYLLLTAGSGPVLLWSPAEIAAGIILSGITAGIVRVLFGGLGIKANCSFLNPVRWLEFAAYVCGPFLWSLTKANIDVVYRVLTGNIRPGIVKVRTGLKNDFGAAMLANSITLTPGTLSVDVDAGRNIYVHCLHLRSRHPKPEHVCGSFIKWVRRITE